MERIEKTGVLYLDNHRALDVYGTIEEPYFKATDVARLLDYHDGKTDNMLTVVNAGNRAMFLVETPYQNTTRVRASHFVNEPGLLQIFSASIKPLAIDYYNTAVRELIRLRNEKYNIVDFYEDIVTPAISIEKDNPQNIGSISERRYDPIVQPLSGEQALGVVLICGGVLAVYEGGKWCYHKIRDKIEERKLKKAEKDRVPNRDPISEE